MKRTHKKRKIVEMIDYTQENDVDNSFDQMNPFSLDQFPDTTNMTYPSAENDIKDVYDERKKRAFTNPSINPNCLLHPDMRRPEKKENGDQNVNVTVNNQHRCCVVL